MEKLVTKAISVNRKEDRTKFDNYCAFAMVPMAGLYIWLLFQVLPGTNVGISTAILGTISLLCLTMLWTVHKISKRWIYSIILACLPWCIYSLLQDGNNIWKSGKVVYAIIAVALVIAVSTACLCNLKKHKTRPFKAIVGACMSIAVFFMVASVPVISLINQTAEKEYTQAIEIECVQESTIENNVELLSKAYSWETLSIGSRLGLLQKVAEIETAHLGLTEMPTVRTDSMDNTIVGSYLHVDNIIRINFDKLSDSSKDRGMKLVATILHECFHAWEYQIVDVYQSCQDERVKNTYPYNQARRYYSELEGYISSNDDLKEYEKQLVEGDAYAYEDARSKDYENAIKVFLSK